MTFYLIHMVHRSDILVVCKILRHVFFNAGKELEVMKEKGERAEELEIQMQKLERDKESLQKKVASLGITCEKVCFTCTPISQNNVCKCMNNMDG